MIEEVFVFPTSFSQQRLWFLDQLEPGNPTYHLAAGIKLEGRLDVSALTRSLDEIIRRHEALRTTFALVEEEPVQIILPELTNALPTVDLSGMTSEARETESRALALAESQRPFDLSAGPLLRTVLLHLDDREHLLLLTIHHIVCDGWSIGVFIRELTSLYEAFCRRQPSPLPELPLQYADFVLWQREGLQDDALTPHLDYWRAQLADVPVALELPTDHPRPRIRNYVGDRRTLLLSEELTQAIKRLSSRERATPFMTLLAAFKVLLLRYTGQEDIVVGTPVAGHNTVEVENLIGFFLNTLVLRTRLADDPTFRELLARVRETTLGAYAHQELPFEKLLEELQPERDLSRTPLFQVFFNMLSFPENRIELPELTVEIMLAPEVGSKFDLTLYLEEKNRQLKLELVYNAALFEPERMAEMLEQFKQLLSEAVQHPEERISRFSLVTPTAQRVLPDPTLPLRPEWAGAVHTFFTQHAQRRPQHLAVVSKDERWSYGELDSESNRLANYLLAHGIERGDIVAVYAHRSVPLVVALLGIIKAGAAFLILDPAYPASRQLDYLEVATPRGWIQIEAAGSPPPALEAYAATLDCRLQLATRDAKLAGDELAAVSSVAPPVTVGPEDMAYVSFTSGSSGKPKGVVGKHGSLAHFAPWARQIFGLDERERFCILSGLSHDPLHRDIFTPLQLGATICIPDPEDIGLPLRLARWIQQREITVANLTPAIGRVLGEAMSEEAECRLTSVRHVFFVGDVLTKRDVRRLRELAPSVMVVNLYGSTETSRAVGYFVVPDEEAERVAGGQFDDQIEKEVITLGRGIRDVQLLVFNAARHLAGIGEIGEIYFRSPHIARGYLRNEELTRERFVVNPLTHEASDRLYRTGDLGRYLPDGTIEPLGRADNQVKIRGFRVELEEIEAALGQHPCVRESAVIAQADDAAGEKRLVAYIVAQEELTPGIKELRRMLKERLPEYMIPGAYVMLDALPLTPNGKLDRRALPAPEQLRPEVEESFVAPRSVTEEMLVELWADVLRVDKVGVHDNFFELGGHSLLAARLISRIRSSFQVDLSLISLFETPTVGALAQTIEMQRQSGTHRAATPLTRVQRDDHTSPLSFAQQSLWFLDRLHPGKSVYHIVAAFRLKGRLDVAGLEQCLNEIVRRHESLRTAFAVVDGAPVQVIQPSLTLTLPLADLRELPPGLREDELRYEARKPFDLERGPLLRTKLFRLDEDEHVLLTVMHHIVSDGWSLGLFIEELAKLYGALSTGEAAPLPELPVQYADFAHWQHRWLQGEDAAAQLSYWKEQLGGTLPLLPLPTDRPRPAVETFRGRQQIVLLPSTLDQDLRSLRRQESVTLFMLLLAAFKTLLYRYTGQADVVVGTPVAGRSHVETQALIGLFVNTLALRSHLSGSLSFRELLGSVRAVALGAFAHQDVPFEKLVAELQPHRNLSGQALFQVMLVLHNSPFTPIELPGLDVTLWPVDNRVSKFDLTLSVIEEAEGLRTAFEYNTDLFDDATIERMHNHLRTLLESVAANPDQRLADIPLLSNAEERQILFGWNETRAAFEPEMFLHELIEAQVSRTPSAIAVTYEREHLTYQELNDRANRLAHLLRRLGVGPDMYVGVLMQRSVEMVVSLLGVLKSGGAYVPLDPDYPAERLSFMLRDCGASLLLTRKHLLKLVPERQPARVLALDEMADELAGEPAQNPEVELDAGNLAYMIYTSGSTGTPKGAMNTHGGIANRLRWMQQQYQLTAVDVVLQKTPFSFDVSVWEFFWPLMVGARLVVARPEGHRDAAYLAGLISGEGVTTLHFVPPMLGMFLDEAGAARCRSVRRVICSGEALTWELQERFFERVSCSELHNLYGPTEAAVDVTHWKCLRDARRQIVPIGRPIANTQIYVLDGQLRAVPSGVVGELYIGGAGLARGYHGRAGLTAERFIPHPHSEAAGERLYRTGDLARLLPDGVVEYVGRSDYQVKVRGFRIELGEIEAALAVHERVSGCVVVAREEAGGDKRLVAYFTANNSGRSGALKAGELREHLEKRLPAYMLPQAFVQLAEMPLTANGKVDRRALPPPESSPSDSTTEAYAPPRSEIERTIAAVWQETLALEKVGVNDNFFDLGGHSLLMAKVHSRLRASLQTDLTMVDLFTYPTVSSLARYLTREEVESPAYPSILERSSKQKQALPSSDIAVIAINGRYPHAKNIEDFWRNLRDGVECISFFSDDEIDASSLNGAALSDPQYVKAAAILEDVELFDGAFFGFNPREAEIMDPQHRLFLEGAWEALESAGYDSQTYDGLIGVYAGASINSYLLHFYSHARFKDLTDRYQLLTSNAGDYLPTRVSYKLNLTGPSVNIQTACSTSLVAVHMACQDLLHHQCDIALAGGVSVAVPQKSGYLYQKGMPLSPDGHCRAFDAEAAGTVGGSGLGIVVLKRLTDALADGDQIHAVIKGSAVNNDGSQKVGYTAPSVAGQSAAIAAAQAMAGIKGETVTYLEAHGTGTTLGDPIEIEALTQAFRAHTPAKNFCAIGSVKTNVGHLDAAAGVTGLIKTVLSLKHRQIAPTLNFKSPNPKIDFANSPFYVNTALAEWKADGSPRRAGVSSFGLGGTNAHVVLEEAPAVGPSGESRPFQLLLLSAKTGSALDAATVNLATHLRRHPETNLADVAYTLKVGRRTFDHRRMLVCPSMPATEASELITPARMQAGVQDSVDRPVVFMFPGQGSQYVEMGAQLYRSEPVFRAHLDLCAEMLRPHLNLDLRAVLYPSVEEGDNAASLLDQTWITQPALFAVEYALAQLWLSWGVRPQAMIGHSIGEYVAACLAGVFSLEDALSLVAARGRLIQRLPRGAMLAVPLSEQEVQTLLGEKLSLAVVNSAKMCIISGESEAVDELKRRLESDGLACRLLKTSHAFHSRMMESILDEFENHIKTLTLKPPQIPYVGNVTGRWISATEATNANYWARHLRQTVRFADGLSELLKERDWALLEVGPGQTLSRLARQHPQSSPDRHLLSTLRHPESSQPDGEFLMNTVGQLWLAGATLDWSKFYAHERRHRVSLPTYPFERQRYWISSTGQSDDSRADAPPPGRRENVSDWFYIPSWKLSMPPKDSKPSTRLERRDCCLVFIDRCGVGSRVVAGLKEEGHEVITVVAGEQFSRSTENLYYLNPRSRLHYDLLMRELRGLNQSPDFIMHLWSLSPAPTETESFDAAQDAGFYSLLYLAQSLGNQDSRTPVHIEVVSNNISDVTGGDALSPEKTTIIGACKVIPQEYAGITCRCVDMVIPAQGESPDAALVKQLIAERRAASKNEVIAYRGGQRWVQTFEPVSLEQDSAPLRPLREGGVYLITGGLGGLGLVLAEHLAQSARAKLILVSRSGLPERESWREGLESDDAGPELRQKIERVQALEKLGAEVLIFGADVANAEQMRDVVARSLERFGKIDGVIHAAGVAGGGLIQLKTKEAAEKVLSPKARGLLVLDALLKEQQLDFLVLFSSLNSIVGGAGQVDYCAANIFLDAFAQRSHANHQTNTISINWGAWREVGMAVDTSVPSALTGMRQQSLVDGISPAEGLEAFKRILSESTLPRVVVSPKHLQSTIDRAAALRASDLLETIQNAPAPSATHARPQLQTPYVAPETELERTVAAIWQQALGLGEVGLDDDFFALGGHSLIAIRVVSRLQETFDVELPIQCVFDAPTVGKLVALVEARLDEKKEALPESEAAQLKSGARIIPRRIQDGRPIPLSFAQQRLWFFDQINPGSYFYNIYNAVELEGQLDAVLLEQSFNEVVRRHEILRTTFSMADGQPFQVIAPTLTLKLPLIDLSHLSADEQHAEAVRRGVEDAQQPMSLERGPLLRVKLLKLDERKHVLLCTMHHIIGDAWSMRVLVYELVQVYAALRDAKPSPLPELDIQYADFACWQRNWLQGDTLADLLAYWTRQLAGTLPVLELPTDQARPAVQSYRGAIQTLTLPETLAGTLKALCLQEKVTPFTAFTTAFKALLYCYTGQPDMVIGANVANRSRSQTEALIGFFINQLVLRTDLSGDPSFRELLGRVREVAVGAFAHQDLPFDKLVQAVKPDRHLSRHPLFQVKIEYNDAPMPSINQTGLTLKHLELIPGRVHFDLTFSVENTEAEFKLMFLYNTDLFTATTIARLQKQFETLLRMTITQPDIRLERLKEVIAEADRQQQLALEKSFKESFRKKLKTLKRVTAD